MVKYDIQTQTAQGTVSETVGLKMGDDLRVVRANCVWLVCGSD